MDLLFLFRPLVHVRVHVQMQVTGHTFFSSSLKCSFVLSALLQAHSNGHILLQLSTNELIPFRVVYELLRTDASLHSCALCQFQDVFQRILRSEGIFSFWKGFTPYFSRLGPHTILTFIFIEQLNIQYQRRVLKNENYSSTL